MSELICNRLTVLGSERQVNRFLESNWERLLRANYKEWLQNSPGRYVCDFKTQTRIAESLKRLSRRWPRLTLLVDWEDEAHCTKGLAKATAGKLEHCEI